MKGDRWPRSMSLEVALEYLSAKPDTFRKKVAPHIRRVPLSDKRKGYLRDDIDAWIDREVGITEEIVQPKLERGINPLDVLD